MPDTLDLLGAISILFGEDWDGDLDASFRSGSDVCAALAEHFDLDPERVAQAYSTMERRRLAQSLDANLPEGDELCCPRCGCQEFAAYCGGGQTFTPVRIRVENGVRVEDDSGSNGGSFEVYGTESYGCAECGEPLDITEAVPVQLMPPAEPEEEAPEAMVTIPAAELAMLRGRIRDVLATTLGDGRPRPDRETLLAVGELHAADACVLLRNNVPLPPAAEPVSGWGIDHDRSHPPDA